MIVLAVILFGVSALFVFGGVRQLSEKGYLFNNAWIWASESERQTLDKRPYYRQSGTVFLLMAGMWLFIGLYVLLESSIMMLPSALCMTAATIYAVVSSARIDRQQKAGNEKKI